ncbi:cell division/cell wall cluster transcriptional repressor MraZ [Pseudooceanicola sp. CBS1P-1]|uniref:Transcriptional regulator MraZ n=1 Tax=Pseudooceanicola albus TaxID=2692189 RepID=A0A6L7G7G4_9RHOB|nr:MULTISPECIES: cell division/cell wall cluster transcriptional repressor MraZ [Pseudooceanicola]MBT9383062.1 cell division/cell wall cluster transcriptional repressor MraZ [Pseudooceanicola endophyticus]MXN19250.1 cell division/cell wall cluster transcriptional repressor MraZ [Pseudooceanicola albus]
MSIPAKFRSVLEQNDPDWEKGESVVMVAVFGDHLSDHVECYTVAAMTEIEDMIEDMPQGDAETEALIDCFLTQSMEFSIDDTGRIVLPARLRAKIGIEPGEAISFVGRGKTFEIWNPDTFSAARAAKRESWQEERGLDLKTFNPQAIFDKYRKPRTTASAEEEN